MINLIVKKTIISKDKKQKFYDKNKKVNIIKKKKINQNIKKNYNKVVCCYVKNKQKKMRIFALNFRI